MVRVLAILLLSLTPSCATIKGAAEAGGESMVVSGAAAAATIGGGPLVGLAVGAVVHLSLKAAEGVKLQDEVNSGKVEYRYLDPTKAMLFKKYWYLLLGGGLMLLLTKREWVVKIIKAPFKKAAKVEVERPKIGEP